MRISLRGERLARKNSALLPRRSSTGQVTPSSVTTTRAVNLSIADGHR
jgi:hypothetical protein